MSATATASVTIWEVLHDGPGAGPAGDGTYIARFRTAAGARTFAAQNTCYGRTATATPATVPQRLAQRWGLA